MNARRISPVPSPTLGTAERSAVSLTLPAPPDGALLAASGLPLFAPNTPMTREIFDEYGPLEEVGLEEVGPAGSETVNDISGVYEVQLSEADLLERAGSFERVPVVLKTIAQLRTLPLDPASAFLVGAMDGTSSIELLFDLAPMPRKEIVRALCLLFDHGVISLA